MEITTGAQVQITRGLWRGKIATVGSMLGDIVFVVLEDGQSIQLKAKSVKLV